MYWCYQTNYFLIVIWTTTKKNGNKKNNNKKLDKLPKEWADRNHPSNMSTSDYTYSPLYNNNGNAPHSAAINHPSTSTFHTNYYSSSYYPPYNQQLPHTNVNNNFLINNNNNIDERDTSNPYGLPSNNQTQSSYPQQQPFRGDTYNGGVGSEEYRMASTATNWFKSDESTEQQSNVMNIISMANRWVWNVL